MKLKVLLILFYSVGSISILRSLNYGITILMVLSTFYSFKRLTIKQILEIAYFMLLIGALYTLLAKRLPVLFLSKVFIFYGTYVFASDHKVATSLRLSLKIIIRRFLFVSLFFWVLHVLLGSSIIGIFPFDLNLGSSFSIGLYNFHFRADSLFSIPFNCGFAWEPGPFAIVLFIGLLFERPTDRRNKTYILFYFLAILSTLSITGYILLTLYVLHFLSERIGVKKVGVLIGAVLVLIIFSLEGFSSGRFTDDINEEFEFYLINGKQTMTSVGRFTGFLFNIEDFRRFPLFGYGPRLEQTITNIRNLNIWSTSGLGNYLAQFGVVGLLFLSAALKSLQPNSKNHTRLLLIASFLAATFAFDLLLTPLMAIYLGVFRND